MSSITQNRIGRYTYLYESTSFWDSNSKYPDNKKKSVGMIDPVTGDKYYKQEYIDRLKQEGKPTDDMKVWRDHRQASINDPDTMALAQEILGTVKNFGLSYFLQSIAENTGVVEILRQSIPKCWRKIIVLACYLVAEDKAVAYCEDWTQENECLDAGSMASQRISELLCAFGYNERTEFFKRWYQHVREKEYVALDITSVSSYSENIGLLGWGYNRDGEDLPQANICLLYGENSMMPVYQTVYAGSLTDVTTLETTLNEFSAITGTTDIMVVMDKGFFKIKNINKMLGGAGHPPYKFLVPVSFTANFAKDQVENERASIDDIDNVIFTRDCDAPVRGIHRYCHWNKDTLIHTHIFHDPVHALAERNERYSYVTKLKIMALKDCKDPKHQKEFKHYLSITDARETGGTVTVEIRKDAVEESLLHSGWLILISNQIDCSQKAHDLYRAKDVVEKSFFQYKNNLGLYRLRVHSDERALNKTFIAFIALIISSHIHKVMRDKDLDDSFTFGKLLSTLSKLKIAYLNGIPVLQPLTKEQKLIFTSFTVALPGSMGE